MPEGKSDDLDIGLNGLVVSPSKRTSKRLLGKRKSDGSFLQTQGIEHHGERTKRHRGSGGPWGQKTNHRYGDQNNVINKGPK